MPAKAVHNCTPGELLARQLKDDFGKVNSSDELKRLKREAAELGRQYSHAESKEACEEQIKMSFVLYFVGFVILICELVYGAIIMHVATHWIVVGATVLLCLAETREFQKDTGQPPLGVVEKLIAEVFFQVDVAG